ncbi:hypothetical protein A3768_4482 (plasmid) [Ralstonia solanacearum]|nr:hypothetical protein A3768_4482 [Ralstonia solanacearum]
MNVPPRRRRDAAALPAGNRAGNQGVVPAATPAQARYRPARTNY